MILGNQVEWALHCVILLASIPDGNLVSSKTFAEFYDVPKEYLSKCLHLLSNAGIVTTTTGPRGGFALAKSPDKISFLDVVEAVEGKTKTFKCSEIRRNNPCLAKSDRKFSGLCEIATVMYEADEAWRKTLRERKISDVVSQVGDRLSNETIGNLTNYFSR